MTIDYKVTELMVSVHASSDNPIFGDTATHIRIEDEAGGGFVVLTQTNEVNKPGELRFDIDELHIIYSEAVKLMAQYNINTKE
jgi:hypothetical protein